MVCLWSLTPRLNYCFNTHLLEKDTRRREMSSFCLCLTIKAPSLRVSFAILFSSATRDLCFVTSGSVSWESILDLVRRTFLNHRENSKMSSSSVVFCDLPGLSVLLSWKRRNTLGRPLIWPLLKFYLSDLFRRFSLTMASFTWIKSLDRMFKTSTINRGFFICFCSGNNEGNTSTCYETAQISTFEPLNMMRDYV